MVASVLLFVLAASSVSEVRAPAGDLSGPPFVSRKSWAVADGCNGALLWGHEADTPRKSASTTKIMCAYVVLQLAQSQPGVLDEVVTFSQLADETPGSTAGVREGESLPVRECLYGLLLPSGNDAGNALAEHFNDRLSPPEYSSKHSNPATLQSHPTRANFIAEMNRTGERLGLSNTFYRSPYGDGGTADDRTTTARDLSRLGWTAMQDPLFRQYVSTAEYATTDFGPPGRKNRPMSLLPPAAAGAAAGFAPSPGPPPWAAASWLSNLATSECCPATPGAAAMDRSAAGRSVSIGASFRRPAEPRRVLPGGRVPWER